MALTQADKDWIRQQLQEGRSATYGGATPRQVRRIVREEIEPLKRDIGGLKRAVLVLARNAPGSVPGVESHVEREVREALGAP